MIGEVPAPVLAAQLNLPAAWERVSAKAGMPGTDEVSVRGFSRGVPHILRSLESNLAACTYHPTPLRVAEVEKKKPAGGGPVPRRLLLIPCVADRVLLSAAATWLGARWNRGFDPCSFAYRPGYGVQDALRTLAALRERGFHWILDCDLEAFFDSIDHSLLLSRLQAWLGPTSPMLRWLHDWIAAPVWDGERVTTLACGVPQGSPLSPLLANYFLDSFDRSLRAAGIEFIRYADDFLVLARSPFEVADYRKTVEGVLADLHLKLNAEKTRVTSFDAGFRFLGAEIQGERILLPFDKKKTPRKPVFVAAPMPPALLRAWRAGQLKSAGPWVWRPHQGRPSEAPPVKSLFAANTLDLLRSGGMK